jgi:hypothetical protein
MRSSRPMIREPRSRWRFGLLAALALAIGCDARATSTDPQGAAPRAEQKSREWESCGATVHCADELRCFDLMCRRTTRSMVGDYYGALADELRGKGKLDEAVAAFVEALARYEAEKIAVPADTDCAYGGALAATAAANPTRKEQAELAARVLHRCLLAVPVGSMLYTNALTELTRLDAVGLEPASLARAQAADLYLTKEPSKKGSDAVTVTVTAAPMPSGKTFGLVLDEIKKPELRGALVACWEKHADATKHELVASFGLKGRYVAPEYDDEPGSYTMTFEPGSGGAAEECVRTALEPVKKTSGVKDSATTKLTVTLR